MLSLGRFRSRTCQGLTRRAVLQIGASSLLGLSLPDLLRRRAEARVPATATAQSVLLLWLWGGRRPSQARQEVMRWMLSGAGWDGLGPAVGRAKEDRGGRRPELPDRVFLEALLYVARTGVPWRDPPGDFGAWDAVYNRFRRWVHSGGPARPFEALTGRPQFGEGRRVLIDPTIIRAHAHAAGARKKEAGRRGAAAAAGAGPPARSSRPRRTRTRRSRWAWSPARPRTPRRRGRCSNGRRIGGRSPTS